jgi:DNA-binding LacI/PurR family transcriptional regulator
MADIAAHLGVSRQLVSIVLRDGPGASADTRARVRQAAQELGYNPHIGARTLRQSRSRQIGVAFAPAHGSEPDIVEAIYPAASEHSYQVVLSAQTGTRSTGQAFEELLGYRCAAIIVIGSDLNNTEMRTLVKRVKVPVVVVGAGERNTTYDVVRSAGDTGIALAVEHLVEFGHEQIAYIHAEAMPAAALRLKGYARATEQAGIAEDVVVVAGPDYTEESGADAARRLLARRQLPTAIVAGNDQVAVGAMQVLSRAGVALPQEVSMTGFDDSRFAQLSSIDLTTARQDPRLMGECAIGAAIRRINDATLRPSLRIVQPTLVVRSSTSAPRE